MRSGSSLGMRFSRRFTRVEGFQDRVRDYQMLLERPIDPVQMTATTVGDDWLLTPIGRGREFTPGEEILVDDRWSFVVDPQPDGSLRVTGPGDLPSEVAVRPVRQDTVARRIERLISLWEERSLDACLEDLDVPATEGNLPEVEMPGLNDSQLSSVRRALGDEPIVLIRGPPGTGKTEVISRIVKALFDRGERILLTAHTNLAVDNMLTRVARHDGIEPQRFGDPNSVTDLGQPFLVGDADLAKAKVVGATVIGCGATSFQPGILDVAIIDEASQVPAPLSALSAGLARRMILVGDDRQLEPVLDDGLPESMAGSIFAWCLERGWRAEMLSIQYRMRLPIGQLCSDIFYAGKLETADFLHGDFPDAIEVIDTSGKGLHEDRSGVGVTNPGEAELVKNKVETLLKEGVEPEDIGVISPYRAQAALIGSLLPEVEVATVYRFQGREKRVIIISWVASNPERKATSFIANAAQVNVAISRAKERLVLVGDRMTLTSLELLARLYLALA